jgi:hypothetical protein
MPQHEVQQRIPAGLWTALQDVCYAQDVQFVKDVAKLLGKDPADMRRRILGARGELATVVSDSDPWWTGTQCTLLTRGKGGLWVRCNHIGESNGQCWEHRTFAHSSQNVKRMDDPYFEELPRRYPIRFQGEIVWVCEKGSVLTGEGEILADVRMDPVTAVATALRTSEAPLATQSLPQE